jgi:hypothetical protein
VLLQPRPVDEQKENELVGAAMDKHDTANRDANERDNRKHGAGRNLTCESSRKLQTKLGANSLSAIVGGAQEHVEQQNDRSDAAHNQNVRYEAWRQTIGSKRLRRARADQLRAAGSSGLRRERNQDRFRS